MNEKMVTIIEYVEAYCPYCRYIYYAVLRDIVVRRRELSVKLVKGGRLPLPLIDVKLVDVDGNLGSLEMQWFKWFSKRRGGEYTPLVRVGDKGFYLWLKEKPTVIKKEEISRTVKLKAEILQQIEDITSRVDKKPVYYDKEAYNGAKIFSY